jgi:hypothetical protein
MSWISPKLAAALSILAVGGFASAAALPSAALAARSMSIVGAWKGQLTASPTSDPGLVAVTDTGPGLANDIGPFQLRAAETDSFIADMVTGGTFTISDARGDGIHGTYGGTFSPLSATAVVFTSPGQITGGTGKLRGAIGPITFEGLASSSSFTDVGGFEATISLP